MSSYTHPITSITPIIVFSKRLAMVYTQKTRKFRNMEINVPVHLSTSHVPCTLYIYVICNAGILNEYCDIKGSLLYIL